MPQTPNATPYPFFQAKGKIDFNLTNDYMFHAAPQRNPQVLIGPIAALLHLQPEEITSIEIRNPLVMGESIKDKGFILDIFVCINHSSYINLEMQLVDEDNWSDRSLSYLCRSYDNLYKGEDYQKVRSAFHIGFLNFQPFENNTEFCATYKLINVKNGHLYSDKFTLYVVDLTHIELATDEDRSYGIDQWAQFFTANTWEDIQMLAGNNKQIAEFAQTLYECNDDFVIREQCYARAEEIKRQKYYETTLARQEKELKEQADALAEHKAALEEHKAALEEKDSALAKQAAEIARLKALLKET